jgi:hypothetical protein
MVDTVLSRVPMVAGVAYIERVRRLPSTFAATLIVEPDNRYFRHAIAVLFQGEKIGYVAPEVAAGVFDSINGASAPITCPARRAAPIDHESSGVEILLDFSGLSLVAAE